MKTIRKTMLMILLLISYNALVVSQDLDLMPKAKRDSILIAKAKDVVLKYGPSYYRECKEPVIMRGQEPNEGKFKNRIYYSVKSLYDKTQEQLGWDYASIVRIWADTGEPSSIKFGNGAGKIISETKLRNPDEITQVPYQQMVVPIYDVNNPQRPKNYDELIRKGYVDRGDGQWRKTRPDVPPAEVLEVLKREGYEEKNGRWIQVRPAESSLELKK